MADVCEFGSRSAGIIVRDDHFGLVMTGDAGTVGVRVGFCFKISACRGMFSDDPGTEIALSVALGAPFGSIITVRVTA